MQLKLTESLNADLYISIMEDELQESLHYYNRYYFSEDKHTSRKAQNWFKDDGISVMK